MLPPIPSPLPKPRGALSLARRHTRTRLASRREQPRATGLLGEAFAPTEPAVLRVDPTDGRTGRTLGGWRLALLAPELDSEGDVRCRTPRGPGMGLHQSAAPGRGIARTA